jgi:hypothetical protein
MGTLSNTAILNVAASAFEKGTMELGGAAMGQIDK